MRVAIELAIEKGKKKLGGFVLLSWFLVGGMFWWRPKPSLFVCWAVEETAFTFL